ncbi:hypothetical protein C7446_0236 [Kushneria sinocarnis]|uniref:FixH protein n=1 Tax=Kushneria sinocarnis TaxID=595502 RepID=A0A420X0X7_9GAMM|nr:hypothetical protein [Kushneria sinocarnis]RKR07424.1 hypothetical protein C7446_0236 [Kushneria sinocarnis]
MCAVRIDRHHEDQPRPPVLNALILVTLVTIVVACWYLGDYYLGSAGERTRWFAPSPFCDVLAGSCHTRLGQQGSLVTRLESAPQRVRVSVTIDGLDTRAVEAQLEGRSVYTGEQEIRLQQVAPHRYAGTLPMASCERDSHSWRLRIRVEDRAGVRLGSWYDFDSPCQ